MRAFALSGIVPGKAADSAAEEYCPQPHGGWPETWEAFVMQLSGVPSGEPVYLSDWVVHNEPALTRQEIEPVIHALAFALRCGIKIKRVSEKNAWMCTKVQG